MRVIHVLRKPLSEGTVASNTLKHGVGGLNIDASRIAHDEPITVKKAQVGGNRIYNQSGRYEATTELKPSGRWPANVILQHLDGCKCEGTKKVKACGVGAFKRSTAKDRNGQTGAAYGAESRPEGTEYVNYADPDGKEAVANWICAEGCPVAGLDEQSGVSKSTGGRIGNKDGFGGGLGIVGFTKKHEKGDPGFGDTGGASRFFKQIGGKVSE
jgi:hypothetical protein